MLSISVHAKTLTGHKVCPSRDFVSTANALTLQIGDNLIAQDCIGWQYL